MQVITKEEKCRRLEEEKKKDVILDSVPRLHEEIENLKHEILKRDEEIAQREGDAIILEDLHRKGLIDSEGHILQNFME